MFEIIGAVVNGHKKIKKVVKKFRSAGKVVSSAVKFKEVVKGALIGYLKGLAILIVIVVIVVGGIVESITAIFDFFKSKGGTSYDPITISEQISDEDAKMMVEGGGINPKKLKIYAEVEGASYPKSATVKMHTIDDGKDKVSDYKLDLTPFSARFKAPWQFIAGIDVLNDSANDIKNKTITDAAKTSMSPTFTWGYDKYTKDETDSRKDWIVETEDGKVVTDTESNAKQIDITKKWPLPFADEVTTPFKKYLYEYSLDKVTRDDPWSKPIVLETKEWDETVQDGVEDDLTKPIYTDDASAPIYDDDYSKPIYESVKYNKFKIYNKRGADVPFHLKDSVTGGYKFSGNEWFECEVINETVAIFKDTSYFGNGFTITLKKGIANYFDVFYFDSSYVASEKTGKFEKMITGYGKKVTGYEQKPKYKKVHHIRTSYKKIKKKIVEDVLSNTNEYTEPQGLISFFNANDISIGDLDLVYSMLENVPNVVGLKEDIKDIIDGNYSDSGVGGIGGGVLIEGSSYSGDMPLFIQWDSRWGNIAYGNSGTIGSSGCGPTSMAMVITGLRGNVAGIDQNNDGIVDPSETSAYSVKNGFRVEGNGTSWDFFKNIGTKVGLKVTQVTPSNYQQVLDHLLKGNPVIASMGPSTFTKGGHFIVLTGVDESGKITVKDPNSELKSSKSWDFISTIIAEGKQFWLVENPDLFNSEGIFQVTAYGGVHSKMEGGGVTADGTSLDDKDFRNRIIAVDRTQIRLGTKVYMQFPESKRYIYKGNVKYDLNGWYTARDVGGAIRTNKIDLFIGFGGAPDIKIIENFGRVDGIKVQWRK